jgi:hypothetical protein
LKNKVENLSRELNSEKLNESEKEKLKEVQKILE